MSTSESNQPCSLKEILGMLDCLLDQPAVDFPDFATASWDNMEFSERDEIDYLAGEDPVSQRVLSAKSPINSSNGLRPKSFLHDEMFEFNQIFAELVQPKRRVSKNYLSSVEESVPLVETDSELSTSHCKNSICGKAQFKDSDYLSYPSLTNHVITPSSSDTKYQPNPLLCDFNHEDDNDSGYQSGNNTLVASMNKASTGYSPGCFFTENKTSKVPCIEQGFIRVQMNLNQPISMALETVNETSCQNSFEADPFYLPNDTVIVIHITSKMTTVEVIQTLLDKYMITNSSNKFALYEKTVDNSDESRSRRNCNSIRRLGCDEHPLERWLCWTDDIDSHQFVLQDNVTSEVAWDAFSIPELDAFLHILEREERAYIDKITHKYSSLKAAAIQRTKELLTLRLEADRKFGSEGSASIS